MYRIFCIFSSGRYRATKRRIAGVPILERVGTRVRHMWSVKVVGLWGHGQELYISAKRRGTDSRSLIALEKGDENVLHQVGEGKDILSVLSAYAICGYFFS